jgi:two-component system sensor histidine kinase DesK
MPQHNNRIDPAVWLVYLAFYLMGPIYVGDRGELVRSAVVIAIFLPIYLWACRRHGWRVLPALAAIALLGVYGCRTNIGAGTFFIYSAALAIRLGDRRRAFGWIGVLLLVEIAAAFFLPALAWGGSVFFFAPILICTILIGVLNIHQEAIDRKNDELRQSRDEVFRLAKIAERERIARDLHDLLGHTLSLVVLKSQLAGRLLARSDGRAATEIAEVERIARQALQEVRTAVAGWRSAGLAAEIAGAALACEAAGLRFGPPPEAVPAGELPPLIEAAMAMTLREAVTNALRHAGATRCRVGFAATEEGFLLEVEDDGRGLPAAPPESGQGLSNIRERAARLGGHARWLPAAGGGTLLRLELPKKGAYEALDRPSPGGREAA